MVAIKIDLRAEIGMLCITIKRIGSKFSHIVRSSPQTSRLPPSPSIVIMCILHLSHFHASQETPQQVRCVKRIFFHITQSEDLQFLSLMNLLYHRPQVYLWTSIPPKQQFHLPRRAAANSNIFVSNYICSLHFMGKSAHCATSATSTCAACASRGSLVAEIARSFTHPIIHWLRHSRLY